MHRRDILAVALAFLTALATLAAGPALAKEAVKPDKDQTVKLSPAALPVIVDRRVINYVFVEVEVLLTPTADVIALRDKEPYFRDALVRAAYRTPLNARNDNNRMDDARLKAALLREAIAIAGPGNVRAIQIDSQTPQHRLSAPPPPAAAQNPSSASPPARR